jgi:hypothetical protein
VNNCSPTSGFMTHTQLKVWAQAVAEALLERCPGVKRVDSHADMLEAYAKAPLSYTKKDMINLARGVGLPDRILYGWVKAGKVPAYIWDRLGEAWKQKLTARETFPLVSDKAKHHGTPE